jgi:uncharacterized repeat protein (TIGR01451 family)
MSERYRGHARRGIAALLGTAALLLAGFALAPAAGAVAPTFTKVFSPDVIQPGDVSTLTFTIDNTANGTDTTLLHFTDTFPTNVVVANPTGASTTCTNPGAATYAPTAGAGSITFDGWTVAANGSCTVTVDVTSSTLGSYDNTSSVLESENQPDTATGATDTLVVTELPLFSKVFLTSPIEPGATSTLEFTIDNTANNTPRSGLDFSDTLPTTPGAMVVAPTPNASKTCTGGTITATAGSGTVSYTGGSVAANDSCTVRVDVTAPNRGTYNNTSGDLTSDAGNSGTATDSLVVNPLVVTKTVAESSVVSGGTANFTISIQNAGNVAVTSVTADDPLATGCNTTFTSIAAGATQTYTCAQANVTAAFTNVVTATGTVSGVTVTATASVPVTVTTPPAPAPGPALALTGSSTGPLTGIGVFIVALGALMVFGASNRRRLLRRS